jgi:hypothetical protein
MTDEETGKYIRILCHQADKGALSRYQLDKICGGQVPEIIMSKLKQDGAGNFYQERMKIEREKRISYSESRRKNRGQIKNDMNNISLSCDKRMGNENINVNKDIIELYNNVVIFFDENCRPKTEKQKDEWCETLEKLVRIDGYSPEYITNIIKRTRMDDFWRTNFLSVLKLRKKNREGIMYFTVFEKKMNNERGTKGAEPIEIIELAARKLGIDSQG